MVAIAGFVSFVYALTLHFFKGGDVLKFVLRIFVGFIGFFVIVIGVRVLSIFVVSILIGVIIWWAIKLFKK